MDTAGNRAAMAVDRAALIAQFSEERLTDPRLLAFIPKIHIQPDSELDALGHAQRYAMIMTVRSANGRTFRRESRDRPGSPGRALTRQQLIDKFRLLATSVLPDETIERIIATVSALDQLETTSTLSDLLVPV